MDQPHTHHDALEFPSGQVVPLTRLREGQFATILQLPASPRLDSGEAKTPAKSEIQDILVD
jgi:hypothetical protein